MAFTPTGVEFIAKGLNRYLGDLGKADKAQQGLAKTAGNVGSGFSSLGSKVLGAGAIVGGAALAGVGALAAGTAALGVKATQTAISFESAFTGVTKTIDGLSGPMGDLTAIGEEIRGEFEQLSTEVPATFEELSAIGEIGGQLGVGANAITDFTETVVQLRDTTVLSAEEAATGIARLNNIYQVSADNMGQRTAQLGSTLVALGNNFATNEQQILNFSARIAGAGQIAGLAQSDLLGIGTAFSSVGIEAEAGGTAVQKVLLGINNATNATAEGIVDYSSEIDKNVDKMTKLQAESARLEAQMPGLQNELLQQFDAFVAAGGSAEDFGRQLGDKTRQKAFETAMSLQELKEETQLLREQHGQPIDTGQLSEFARVAGVSAEEFKSLWQKDASQAFQLFVEGLGREGDNAANVLEDLGLADQRLVRGFLSVAGAGDLLNDTLKTASDAFEENTALSEEAQKRYATTASKIQMLKNTFRVFLAQVGGAVLPLFNRLIETGTEFVKKWAEPIQKAVENIIVPAIGKFVDKVGDIFTAFQEGGVSGIVDALGITPEATELFDKIVGSSLALANTIMSVLMPAFQGLAGGGLLDIINAAISFLNEHFEELKGAIIGIGAALAGAAIVAIIAGIGSAIAALVTPVGLIVAAAALLGAAWAGNWGNIQGITMAVWGAIQPVLMQLFQWLQVQIPAAIQALTTFWQAVLLPAIMQVWQFIQANVFPLFTMLFQWLQVQIPLALQFLTEMWMTVFLPAITAVWNFILTSLVPLFLALANLYLVLVQKATEVLAIIWKTLLLPSLQATWNFIANSIIPIFVEVASITKSVLNPAIQSAVNLFNLLKGAVEKIPDIIGDVVDKINSLAGAISGIDLGVLDPGSPSPFEISLVGIDSALKELDQTMKVSPLFTNRPLLDEGPVAAPRPQSTVNNTRSLEVNMPIYTTAQPQGITQQLEVIRSLVGE